MLHPHLFISIVGWEQVFWSFAGLCAYKVLRSVQVQVNDLRKEANEIELKVAPPLLLGRYELAEKIGEGGFGVVWRPIDLETKLEVAIKQQIKNDTKGRSLGLQEPGLHLTVCEVGTPRVPKFIGQYFQLVRTQPPRA